MKTLTRLLGLAVAFAIVGAGLGCTAKKQSTRVVVQMPNWEVEKRKLESVSTLATNYLNPLNVDILFITVTGPGMSPKLTRWERSRQADETTAVPPSLFSIDAIPKGESRLIQVMVVFKDPDTGGMIFHYGDVTKNLVADVESAEIKAAVDGSSADGEGGVTGRYLRADGSAPSGVVRMKFQPSNGKSAMLLMYGEIIDGWFEFFLLRSVRFTYEMDETGEALFAGVNAYSDSLLGSGSESARAARISIPDFYRSENSDGSSRYQEMGRIMNVGFFGPGAGAKTLCYSATQKDIDAYVAASGTTKLRWVGAKTTPAAGEVAVTAGGSVDSASVCQNTSNEYVDHLSLQPDQYRYRDSGLALRGAFKPAFVSGSDTQYIYSPGGFNSGSGTMTISWAFLPGVVEHGVVDGVDIFTRDFTGVSDSSKDEYRGDMNGFACERLESFGFTKVNSIRFSGNMAVTSAVLTGLTQSTYDNLGIVLCPHSTKVASGYFQGGVDWRNYNWGGGDGGCSTCGSNKQLVVTSASRTVANGQCLAITLEARENGVTTTVASDLVINSSVNVPNGGMFHIFTDGCNGLDENPSTNPIKIATGTSSKTIYFKTYQGGYSNLSFMADQFNSAWMEVGVLGGSPTKWSLSGASQMAVGRCYDLRVSRQDSSSLPAMNASPATVTLGITGTGFAGTYYSDMSCQTALGSSQTTVAANEHGTFAYFKPTSTPTGPATLTASDGSLTNASLTINVGANTLSKYILTQSGMSNNGAWNQYDMNECIGVRVAPANSVDAEIDVSGTTTVNLSISGGLLYSDSGCTTSLTPSSVTLSANNWSSGNFFFKTGSTAPSLTITATDGTYSSGAVQFNRRPPKQLQWNLPFADSWVLQKECYPVSLSVVDSTNDPYLYGASLTIDLSGGNPGAFYSDSNCSSSISSMVLPSDLSTTSTFFVTYTTSGNLHAQINSPWTAGGNDTTYRNLQTLSGLMLLTTSYSGSYPACVALDVRLDNSGPVTPPIGESIPVTVTKTSGTGQLFASSDCSSGGPQASVVVNLTNGSPTGTVYYQANDNTADATFDLTSPKLLSTAHITGANLMCL